jgi:hypothetical protein
VFAGRRAADAAAGGGGDAAGADPAPDRRGSTRPEHSTVDAGAPPAPVAAEAEEPAESARRVEDRPETARLQDFDPVVVDGDDVIVVYTLDGPVVDDRPGRADGAAVGAAVGAATDARSPDARSSDPASVPGTEGAGRAGRP